MPHRAKSQRAKSPAPAARPPRSHSQIRFTLQSAPAPEPAGTTGRALGHDPPARPDRHKPPAAPEPSQFFSERRQGQARDQRSILRSVFRSLFSGEWR